MTKNQKINLDEPPKVIDQGTNFTVSILVPNELMNDKLAHFFSQSQLNLVARVGCTNHDNLVLVLRTGEDVANVTTEQLGCLLTALMGIQDNILNSTIEDVLRDTHNPEMN